LLASIPAYWKSFFEEFASRVGDPRTGWQAIERSLAHARTRSKTAADRAGRQRPAREAGEADQIVKSMKDKNPVTYVLYPDEGHGFVRPATARRSAVAEGFWRASAAVTAGRQ
jgi:hypothetical protein